MYTLFSVFTTTPYHYIIIVLTTLIDLADNGFPDRSSQGRATGVLPREAERDTDNQVSMHINL